ncbi:MAG: [FeFe] hydrogenase H-cluster maturation GTPase HydF [Candidatus Omnitrophota bacterium]|nr:[FeFe] hydrogenase H-cluster maturation GTPase HydF [Candidatus Omnitrophota bacterium]MBU1894866.1 [FeFe] hydrogenase H-cluster maturation GTPase HydF [Candidatus Omnitrophota bacterium]
MKSAPKSVRLQIGLFGRTNVGKSSFLNYVLGQDMSITSSVPGTTTDIVEKAMEFLPVGPVVFLDTAGVDDVSVLSTKRMEKTKKIFDRADIVLLIAEPNLWGEYEEDILLQAKKRNAPFIIIVNKIDLISPEHKFINLIKKQTERFIFCSCVDTANREELIKSLKEHIVAICPRDFIKPASIMKDIVPPGGVAVLIVPIDMEAPKGRIILPQVQAIRSALDNDSSAFIVKENGYKNVLNKLKADPDIVICDSQVVKKMVQDTPVNVKCTTFSILFAQNKGNLEMATASCGAIKNLRPKDKVLILEACSHHPIEDDIGRKKIPAWLSEYVGGDLDIDVYAGRDYPEDFSGYKLVIHCGGCMITKRETFFRYEKAKNAGVPITNYGVCISFLAGVLNRVLAPFPSALAAYMSDQCRVIS